MKKGVIGMEISKVNFSSMICEWFTYMALV